MDRSENYILDNQGAMVAQIASGNIRIINENGNIKIEKTNCYNMSDKDITTKTLKNGDLVYINDKLGIEITSEGNIRFFMREDNKPEKLGVQEMPEIIFSSDWDIPVEGFYSSDIPFIAQEINANQAARRNGGSAAKFQANDPRDPRNRC